MSEERDNAIEKLAKKLCLQTEGWWEDNECEHDHLLSMATELVSDMESLGYRQIPELTVLEVSSHSESISCPHCGEEFGIESGIETAHENQFRHTKRELGE